MLSEFRNEPLTAFEVPANAQAFEAALRTVQGYLGHSYPLLIGAEQVRPGPVFTSINPSDPDVVVGEFAKADATLAQRAVEAADQAFLGWAATPPTERARYLFQAASHIRARKHEFSAIMVYEVGKSWPEADADTSEAIDFLEFYGREMLRLSEPQPLTRIPGEDNDLMYIPLGVGVVIPPWNFPFAIMAGMTSAAIVSGNTVVLKPASTSPLIAYKFCEVLWSLGLPPGVLNFAPGPGGSMGDALVAHPRTRFIAFTGSRDVGLHIHELASRHQPGQIWIKRTILEMGGKDAVIVDAGADLTAAAAGIVNSAFGFQGQKCSAGSRAIIHQDVYDAVITDVVERTKKLKVGDPTHKDTFMGPVVDRNAFAKILDYIEVGTQEGKLLTGGHRVGDKGYFIEPTVFGDVPRTARIAQEEIFGPVLTCLRGTDFDDLLAIGNSTEYGLTGSVYSNIRAHLEQARHAYHVGNLYFNRKCTGALVGVHPFGGFNMSGTDSKAGGRDYLLLFTQAKAVSEKL